MEKRNGITVDRVGTVCYMQLSPAKYLIDDWGTRATQLNCNPFRKREIIRIDRLLRIRCLFPATISALGFSLPFSLTHSLSPLRSDARCKNPMRQLSARAPKLHAFFDGIFSSDD